MSHLHLIPAARPAVTHASKTAMFAPVDLRSDTVTRPTPAMRRAMAEAAVGDDVFDDDPTVHALQVRAAGLVGHEASLFVPSGTMANLLAMMSWCRPGEDVIVGEGAHSRLYEGGGGGAVAGVQFSVIGHGGHFWPAELECAIQTMDAGLHVPPTTLVMVENTHNRGGGLVMPPARFAALAAVTRARNVRLHIDGARLFNAAIACDTGPDAWGKNADSVSFCLSKGLGAPVGSLLCGPRDFITRARRFRKMLGGGMRQVGVLAAAGLVALDDAPQLAADHARARRLAHALAAMPGVQLDPLQVQTNIVIFGLTHHRPGDICAQVADDVLILPFGPDRIRAVLHRDVDDAMLDRAIHAIGAVLG